MKTQKLNVFNIGVTFLTMSLASQLVSYKQRNQAITAEKEQLEERVEVLEALVKSLGGTLPNAEEVAANQEKLAAEKAEAEKAAAAAEERAIAAALVGGSDGKKKGMLI
ncbi:TPA: hypothetical protein N0F65_009088 [Lagenidium giganteum]|uniref:Uncharacterized protein n=1 Tax=Lagenidium giganteum TaxID=4803 RepID=A0AAV2YR24_9STRA|nr:TPA: hypothetical protein N0F65_009088 [Lagenidium giganteum]